MLHPSMSELLTKIDNRYLLVNVTAKRARELAEEAEENEITLAEKPVKLALDDIMSGRIVVVPQQEEAPQAQPEDLVRVRAAHLHDAQGPAPVAGDQAARALHRIRHKPSASITSSASGASSCVIFAIATPACTIT